MRKCFAAVVAAFVFLPPSAVAQDPIKATLDYLALYRHGGLDVGCRHLLQSVLEPYRQPPQKLVNLSDDVAVHGCIGGEWSQLSVYPVSTSKSERTPSVFATRQKKTFTVRIERFDDETGKEFSNLHVLKRGCRLILDLRGNGGGKLRAALKLVDHFSPRSETPIVTLVDHSGEEYVYKTSRAVRLPSCFRFHILVDGNTASASEIVAATLLSWFPEQVTIEGGPTRGKDVYQEVQNTYIYLSVPAGHWFVGAGPTRFSVKHGLRSPGSISANAR